MRASRLVQLLLLLQTNGKMTASRLATELEVSVRTIYRDIEALSRAGVPIYAEAGPGGGVRLVDGYRTRLTGLTAHEAEALALSGLPGAASELGLGTVLAAAQLKVDAALPPELRSRAVRMRERFHLDAPGWFAREELVPHLAALSRAVWDSERVEIRYAKREGETRRVIDPLGLVLKAGVWYLVALSGRTRSMRTFRVSRVQSVRALDEPADRPDDFDLAAQWAESSAAFLDDVAHLSGAGPRARRAHLAPARGARAGRREGGPRVGRARSTPTAGGRPRSASSPRAWPSTSCCASGATSRCSNPPSCATPWPRRRGDGGAVRHVGVVGAEPPGEATKCAPLAASPARPRRLLAAARHTVAMAVAETIECVDCGGRCHRMPFDPPELGWEAGDVVAYRCSDCADMWYLEVDEDDLDDDSGGDGWACGR